MDSSKWRQGDRVRLDHILVQNAGGSSVVGLPSGAAIISQTCDLVRRNNDPVLVAPIVRLAGSGAKLAQRGWQPRYVPWDQADSLFVDLAVIATVAKAAVAAVWEGPHFDPTDLPMIRAFGGSSQMTV